MLGVTERRLKGWERQGLIPASAAFTFSDLIALRTLQKLQESGIPAGRIGRALASLKRKLSGIRHPLAELKIGSDGRAITVHLAGGRMEATTGQFLFNFDTAEIGGVRTIQPRPAADARVQTAQAEAWFQRGLALEETGAPVKEAIEAYRKAVELNPEAAGALLNLGTIHFRLKKLKEAAAFYERAVAVDPRYALAHFNLGNLYDELGDAAAAERHYRRALELNHQYADAHFNLALLAEKRGDPLCALRHWKAYLKLDGASAWADIARRQLARLRDAAIVRR
jgi:tetratricopeptide (TPR) repeat protein